MRLRSRCRRHIGVDGGTYERVHKAQQRLITQDLDADKRVDEFGCSARVEP